MKRKIVVLNSGGFDSIVLLHYLKLINNEEDLHSIHFLYGANNEKQQLDCVNKVCDKLGISNKVIQLPEIDWSKGTFFTNVNTEDKSLQYVEYRNLIFLSYAISYAEAIGANTICLALLNNNGEEESVRYPDSTVEFLQGLNSFTVPFSNIVIDAPFIYDSKIRLAHIAKYLGIKEDEYFSCDKPNPDGSPCGICFECNFFKEFNSQHPY